MHHQQKIVASATVITILVASIVYAGGWAAITVETLPDYFVVGKSVTIPFTVRQHGIKLMDNLTPTLTAENGKEKITATITKDNTLYRAELNLPTVGDWTIKIKSSFGNNDITLHPIRAITVNDQNAPALSEAQRGRDLYVAKGCVVCHQHANAGVKPPFEVARDLTNKQFSADYLQRLLADPRAVLQPKKDWSMPNLNLKSAEINSLVAFLREGKQQAAQ